MTAMAMQKAFTHYSAKMRNDKATAKVTVRDDQQTSTRNQKQ